MEQNKNEEWVELSESDVGIRGGSYVYSAFPKLIELGKRGIKGFIVMNDERYETTMTEDEMYIRMSGKTKHDYMAQQTAMREEREKWEKNERAKADNFTQSKEWENMKSIFNESFLPDLADFIVNCKFEIITSSGVDKKIEELRNISNILKIAKTNPEKAVKVFADLDIKDKNQLFGDLLVSRYGEIFVEQINKDIADLAKLQVLDEEELRRVVERKVKETKEKFNELDQEKKTEQKSGDNLEFLDGEKGKEKGKKKGE